MNDKERIHKAIGEIEGLMNMQLLSNAIQGCALRDLHILGYDDRGVAAVNGNQPLAKALMDLAYDLETRIRNGAALDKALDGMRADGWIERIDNLEMGE